jgi:glutamyl-tRNA synthetase
MLLRMEDLDRERVKPGMERGVLEDLEWLGLDWEGPVMRQSERMELYVEALSFLTGAGLTYSCVCTRREITAAQSAPHLENGRSLPYPGTCRGRYADGPAARAASGREPALRFMPPPGLTRFEDVLCGPQVEDVSAVVGDFPIARRDGEPAYQLAVVVDDAQSGVTEVLRGDDLLSSTARQRVLQQALGLPSPVWVHVPLVTDAGGRRLAKRADDLSLATLRGAGVPAWRVVSWAARTAGMEASERGLAGAYTEGFDISRVPRAPVRLGPDEVPGSAD